MIFVIDFGSQTAHLIKRRISEFGVQTRIVAPEEALKEIKKEKPRGIIFSGGPSGVYVKNAPVIDEKIFSLGIPILGICYGFQLTAKILGGDVSPGKKEYGPAELEIGNPSTSLMTSLKLEITKDLQKSFVVWMSHGDEVKRLPEGFEIIGSTRDVKNAFVGNLEKKIFGVQFHPEVEHTEYGSEILKNFINICSCDMKEGSKKIDVNDLIRDIKENVGSNFVIGAVSGGVDSTVASFLTAKAVGKRFIPVYVENGLMRQSNLNHVRKIFQKVGIRPIVVDARVETLKKLKGISDPEKKRKIIGNLYIELFEKEMEKLIKSGKKVQFLLQGTIYSDVIESQGTKHSSKIKSHHNVGGLPKKMKLKLLEPLRHFYKDEVRQIGKNLGLPSDFIQKQPFPGPGYAVRIRGEVTKERLKMESQADVIVMEELEKSGILSSVFMSFPVLTGALSTAVKGDGRHFGEVVALRIIESKDIMTSTWAKIPYEILQKISSRIVNEVPGVSRVVYDITTKPPATMEWE